MYKVVIIDDEPVIVKGLSRLMPWEKYECEVIGTASDGIEGQALIREKKPDMVFSDIYMPKMNGLLMAAALKSEFEDLEITILTGYRDFELIQEALKIGITRFVLKPSNMEELEEALQAMILKLKKKGIHPQESLIKEETVEQEDEAGNFLVKNALKYMQANYDHKLSLAEVAEHIFVSQWHLSKLLNKHTGQSFSEILNSIRVEKAKELLKDPMLRVCDVGEKVGFLDIAHFSRVFKKVTGFSANEYRNQMK